MRLVRYLLHTMDRGIFFQPGTSKCLDCYVDADFAGGWSNPDEDDVENEDNLENK